MTCDHLDIVELGIFDADGDIVVQRIKCPDCNMKNHLVYDVIEDESIWNNITSRCRHGMYKITSYKKDGDMILCDVVCLSCGFKTTNLYERAEFEHSVGWYEE